MKRKILIFMALAGLLLATPVFAEWEFGVGITPIQAEEGVETSSFLDQMMISGHVGYSFMWLFYGSIDSIILPPMVTQDLSSTTEKEGYYRPGYLNLFDVGVRPRIGPILAFVEVGASSLYVYKQEEIPDYEPTVGFNARAGVGLVLKEKWGVTASGTVNFQELEVMTSTFEDLFNGTTYQQEQATETLMEKLIPTLTFNLYF
jgi:hypothetical protein